MSEAPGSLTVVGTGIRAISQVTLESRDSIATADKVLYLLADPLTIRFVRALSPTAESLDDEYEEGCSRLEIYQSMVERILKVVRGDLNVCVALYGHPGVFAYPGHEAIRRARQEGYAAEMLPGVSAEDCLFADLGVDPATAGCQSYEATDFLLNAKSLEATAPLILWQVGVVGDLTYRSVPVAANLASIVRKLESYYGRDHEVFVYEAAQFHINDPAVRRLSIADLRASDVSTMSTLLVPPMSQARNAEWFDRLHGV